jgi:hypothetical protein
MTAPYIDYLDPANGTYLGGDSVEIYGGNFNDPEVTDVQIDGESADFSYDRGNLNFTTPAHAAGDVDVVVFNDDGESDPVTFTYEGGGGSSTVAQTRVVKWSVANPRSVTRQAKWSVAALVNKTRQVKWGVNGAVSLTRATKWSVASLVNKTRAVKWAVATLVNKTRQVKWGVNGLVAVVRAAKWSVANPRSVTRQAKWSVAARVNQTRAVKWSVASLVSQTRAVKWSVNSLVSVTRAAKWTVAGLADLTRQVKWSVLGPPPPPVYARLQTPSDRLRLYIGGQAPENEVLQAAGLAISGLAWSNVMPGGNASMSFAIDAARPELPLLNALAANAKVWLKVGPFTIWQGWALPKETTIGAQGGTIDAQFEGTLARLMRNKSQTLTVVDADMSHWWQSPNNNGQIGGDNQGHLLLYVNKGSPTKAAETGPGNVGDWVYYVDEGLPTARQIYKVTYDVSWALASSNWIAQLGWSDIPYSYGGYASGGDVSWTNGSGSSTDQDKQPASAARAAMVSLYALADTTGVTATRYIEFLKMRVWTQTTAPTIDSAMLDILTASGLITESDLETLDALNHCAYRDLQSIAAICGDLATRSPALIDWAIYGPRLYDHYRPWPTPATTIALQKGDLADETSDTIVGDYENALDGVMVTYGTDATGADAAYPRGTMRYALYGSTAAVEDRVETLDYSGDIMSPQQALDIATREYLLRSANAYRNSVVVRLSSMLRTEDGRTIDPLLLTAANVFLRRTYVVGEPPIYITGIDADLDGDRMTLSVGSPEDRQLFLPFRLPAPSVHQVTKHGWKTVHGKKVKTSWKVWE